MLRLVVTTGDGNENVRQLTAAVAVAGICILVGGMKYHEQEFQISGANLYLSVLIVLATITLILPDYTLTTPGPVYSTAQLGFVSVVTVILYGVFLYTQTIRHQDYFVADRGAAGEAEAAISGRTLKHVPAKWNPVRRQGHASTVESTAFPVDMGSPSDPISTENAVAMTNLNVFDSFTICGGWRSPRWPRRRFGSRRRAWRRSARGACPRFADLSPGSGRYHGWSCPC